VIAALLGLAICGLLAQRSPLGFGRIARSAMAGLPAAAFILAAAVVAVLLKPRIVPTPPPE
jgi:putative exporter of polyketide antibiotics